MKKLLALLLLLGCGLAAAALWISGAGRAAAEGDHYTLAPVEYGRIAELVNATGLVQAPEVLPVGSEVAGKVVEVLADYNQVVHEGDVLLRLDDRMARRRLQQASIGVDLAKVAVRQAEANRDAAELALQRVRRQAEEVRQQADVDVAAAQVRSAAVGVEAARVRVLEAEEALRQAELGLSQTVIRAPTLGSPAADSATAKRAFTVLDRKASLNQLVGPPSSGELFLLAGAMDRMQVQVQVVEGDVNKIGRGMSARFTVPAAEGDAVFVGRVDEVRLTPVSDRGAVYYKVVVDVANRREPTSGDWLLRPGLTASVDFLRRARDAVWKVPAAALTIQPDPAALTEAARARLAARPTGNLWQTVWTLGDERKPWPVFVRTTDPNGESSLQDGQWIEALEWDAGLTPPPDPRDPATYPRLVIALPPAKKGLFSPPNIKL